ncbi:MAG: hypothetical protein AAF243_14160 [Cyanobacteria bacterium P01_A01_bin.137]
MILLVDTSDSWKSAEHIDSERSQYEAIDIPEYWIVNLQEKTVLGLELVDGS